MDTREEMQKILDSLAQQRDELIVQAHLAKLRAQFPTAYADLAPFVPPSPQEGV